MRIARVPQKKCHNSGLKGISNELKVGRKVTTGIWDSCKVRFLAVAQMNLKDRNMKEKNIVLEWTPIEGSAATKLENYIFTDRKEVRK